MLAAAANLVLALLFRSHCHAVAAACAPGAAVNQLPAASPTIMHPTSTTHTQPWHACRLLRCGLQPRQSVGARCAPAPAPVCLEDCHEGLVVVRVPAPCCSMTGDEGIIRLHLRRQVAAATAAHGCWSHSACVQAGGARAMQGLFGRTPAAAPVRRPAHAVCSSVGACAVVLHV